MLTGFWQQLHEVLFGTFSISLVIPDQTEPSEKKNYIKKEPKLLVYLKL
jgi:hypothetical protein